MLAENMVHFARVLRNAGVQIGPDRVLASIAAVEAVGLDRREAKAGDLHIGLVGHVRVLDVVETRVLVRVLGVHLAPNGVYAGPEQFRRAFGFLQGQPDLPEADFCQWLTKEVGVAAIPLSAFYEGGFEQGIARLCFAKKDETLQLALKRLQAL
jgi:hypothetical protein